MKLTNKMKMDVVNYMNTTGADRATATAYVIAKADEETYLNTPIQHEEFVDGKWIDAGMIRPARYEKAGDDGYAYFTAFGRQFRHAIDLM